MVGLYAEPFPKGFGFSDTAFRVFVLMASRRLEADYFFTDDYRPEIYADRYRMGGVEQHALCPAPPLSGLEPALRGIQNPFAPWNPVR